MRWDSDHVVTLDDATSAILEECVATNALDRIHVGLDFFDASINRIAAWVIGTRNAKKALLRGLLQPRAALADAESRRDFTSRLALMEDTKSLPWGAVWREYCQRHNIPADGEWLAAVKRDEQSRLSKRV